MSRPNDEYIPTPEDRNLNFYRTMAYLFGFGTFGYIFCYVFRWITPPVLEAIVIGVILAAAAFFFIHRLRTEKKVVDEQRSVISASAEHSVSG